MGDLATYIELGFRHITDFKGADHILFLLALAAIYRWTDWRDCVWVATAFTVGHSLTLGLAVTNVVHFPDRVIEFLIPCTIVATVIENVVVRRRGRGMRGARTARCWRGCSGWCTAPALRTTCANCSSVMLRSLCSASTWASSLGSCVSWYSRSLRSLRLTVQSAQ